METECKILLPLKLNFRPDGCVAIGDTISINSVGNLNNLLSVITDKCVFSAEYNPNRTNGNKLKWHLQKGCLTGRVFALFEKYFIVEVLVDESRFRLCN